MARNYREEYDNYQGKPAQIDNRAKRNAARAQVKKKLGAAAVAGKDVHHKTPIRSGGGNGNGNLAVSSVKKNRSFSRGG